MSIDQKKVLAGAAVLLASLSLTGCVKFIGPEEQAAMSQQQQAPATEDAQQNPEQPVGGDGELSWKDKVKAKLSGDDKAEGEGGEGEQSVKEMKKIDLKPESGVQYLRAVQDFMPNLEQWVLDRERGEVTYKRWDCLGQNKAIGSGTLKWTDATGEDSAFISIVWDGSSPLEANMNMSPEVDFEIDDRNLKLGIDKAATSRTDVELERFKGMCGEVADFIL